MNFSSVNAIGTQFNIVYTFFSAILFNPAFTSVIPRISKIFRCPPTPTHPLSPGKPPTPIFPPPSQNTDRQCLRRKLKVVGLLIVLHISETFKSIRLIDLVNGTLFPGHSKSILGRPESEGPVTFVPTY